MSLEAPLPRPVDSDPETQFDQLLKTSVRERLRRARRSDAALGTGELQMQVLCRYATGELQGQAHQDAQSSLSRSPWALSRVTALVKGARTPNSLAAHVLTAARAGDVDAGRLAALELLRELGRDDAAAVITNGDAGAIDGLSDTNAAIRGAIQLGLGQRQAAHTTFADADDLSAAGQLARAIAAEDDPDQALAALLDTL